MEAKMETGYGFLLLLIGSLCISHLVQAQSQEGFISLDCGLPQQDPPYTEPSTGLTFTSDANNIDSGQSGRIRKEYQVGRIKPSWLLRFFPEGARNCYSLNVTKGTNYLISALFLYGNYDDQNEIPSFDLYIGPNRWVSIDILMSNKSVVREIIHIPRSNLLQVCLVKSGPTTPFISSLELRPLSSDSYISQSGSLMNDFRVYLSKSDDFIRYDDDVLDRGWSSYFQDEWTELNTSLSVDVSNSYKFPQIAARTAATPTNRLEPLNISWSYKENPDTEMYMYLYFVEIQELKPNETREFNITLNDVDYGSFSPVKLKVRTRFSVSPVKCDQGSCRLSLVKTGRSTHPPLLNAIEVYTVADLQLLETNRTDVEAIKNIKAAFSLNRISWRGDPCAPKQFMWDGLNCNNGSTFDPPFIISLNLSSSGLTGNIPSAIFNLTHLKELDLSNNNLTGEVPEFLGKMKSLTLINLSRNKLNGSVPRALLDKKNAGSLSLNVEENLNLCKKISCPRPKRKKSLVPAVIGSVAALALIIAVLAAIFILRRRRRKDPDAAQPSMAENRRVNAQSVMDNTAKPHETYDSPFATKERRFSYSEVVRMTRNFEKVLGEGGFGSVFHGFLNGDTQQVAVKMLSYSSAQGYKQFKAEVELLLRVHHKNLVSLVGYCDDKDNLALIYEYMPNGDLYEHLSGKRGNHVLSWTSRLKIAAEAAQGLEYLHKGCKPQMVHRDVKSTNILLNERFQAKLGDFGLSRSFPVEGESHVSTVVAGTPGYLDPEYYKTNWLTEKSDVYSFGIVLLEIITNQQVIDRNREKPHIKEWVGLMLNKGDIRRIMDPKLGKEFETNTAWKAVELAMSCVSPSSSGRPLMSHVVIELNECLASENSRMEGSREMDSKSSIDLGMSFDTDIVPQAR